RLSGICTGRYPRNEFGPGLRNKRSAARGSRLARRARNCPDTAAAGFRTIRSRARGVGATRSERVEFKTRSGCRERQAIEDPESDGSFPLVANMLARVFTAILLKKSVGGL